MHQSLKMMHLLNTETLPPSSFLENAMRECVCFGMITLNPFNTLKALYSLSLIEEYCFLLFVAFSIKKTSAKVTTATPNLKCFSLCHRVGLTPPFVLPPNPFVVFWKIGICLSLRRPLLLASHRNKITVHSLKWCFDDACLPIFPKRFFFFLIFSSSFFRAHTQTKTYHVKFFFFVLSNWFQPEVREVGRLCVRICEKYFFCFPPGPPVVCVWGVLFCLR